MATTGIAAQRRRCRSERGSDMTEKDLRFLNKTQLLSLLRDQEIEIQKLIAEKDAIAAEKDLLVSERDGLLAEKNVWANEKSALMAERQQYLAQRDAAQAERQALQSEREAVAKERSEMAAKIQMAEQQAMAQSARQQAAQQQVVQQEEEQQAPVQHQAPIQPKVEETPMVLAGDAGSLAEASLAISGVMQAAQQSANIYLENIKALEERTKTVASSIESEAKRKADDMIREAELRCLSLEARERQVIDEMWIDFQKKMDHYIGAYGELKDLFSKVKVNMAPVATVEKGE